MQDFEIKRGHGKTLEDGGLKLLMEEEFGEITEEGNVLVASFKALKSIKVEMASITEILVETETDIESSPEDSLAAHQAYNKFMQAATNFNAKQRIDRAKAKAKREAKAAAEKEIAVKKVSQETSENSGEEETGEEISDEGGTEEDNNEESETAEQSKETANEEQ